jgi:hypothetical protein
MDWFTAKYDSTCTAVPVLVHKTTTLHQAASARPGAQVITFEHLAELRDTVRQFAQTIAADGAYHDPKKVAEQLNARHLNGKALIGKWGKPPRKS